MPKEYTVKPGTLTINELNYISDKGLSLSEEGGGGPVSVGDVKIVAEDAQDSIFIQCVRLMTDGSTESFFASHTDALALDIGEITITNEVYPSLISILTENYVFDESSAATYVLTEDTILHIVAGSSPK